MVLGYPQAKEGFLPCTTHKINSKWIILQTKCKSETIKFFKETTRVNLCDLRLSIAFLNAIQVYRKAPNK